MFFGPLCWATSTPNATSDTTTTPARSSLPQGEFAGYQFVVTEFFSRDYASNWALRLTNSCPGATIKKVSKGQSHQ